MVTQEPEPAGAAPVATQEPEPAGAASVATQEPEPARAAPVATQEPEPAGAAPVATQDRRALQGTPADRAAEKASGGKAPRSAGREHEPDLQEKRRAKVMRDQAKLLKERREEERDRRERDLRATIGRVRNRAIFTSSTLVILGALAIGLSLAFSFSARTLFLIGAPFVVLAVFAGAYFLLIKANLEAELRQEKEEEKLQQLVHQKAGDYFDTLVSINVDNLGAYYRLVKVQAGQSFLVSVVSGALGFVLIVTGLAIGFGSDQENRVVSYLSSGSGILIEFMAGVFFYLYRKTVEQLRAYHRDLIEVQNVLLSFKIVGGLPDTDKRIEMLGSMLQYLLAGKGKPHEPTPRAEEETGASRGQAG